MHYQNIGRTVAKTKGHKRTTNDDMVYINQNLPADV